MNELHKGFVLDGYYEYDDGLGVFLKEESGEDYLIFKLERKVEIIDNEFEEERTTVKAIIAKFASGNFELDSSPSHETPGGAEKVHLCRAPELLRHSSSISPLQGRNEWSLRDPSLKIGAQRVFRA